MKKRPISWKKIKSDWICDLANNGWKDWICPKCNKRVWNDDIHVSIDWVYCPYCGGKNVEVISEMTNDDHDKELDKELEEEETS